MKYKKEDIQLDLEHQFNLVRQYNQRLKSLELKEAQKGFNVDSEIEMEIDALRIRIQEKEEKISQLQTLLVEDQLPLFEVEYKLMLAEAWDSSSGKLTIKDIIKLELMRLKFGISQDRSIEMEKEIRIALVQDIISEINIKPLLSKNNIGIYTKYDQSIVIDFREGSQNTIENIYIHQGITDTEVFIMLVKIILKLLRLDFELTSKLFIEIIPDNIEMRWFSLNDDEYMKNILWINLEDRNLISRFVKYIYENQK